MEGMIILSSDESSCDSVEILGCYTNFLSKPDPLPLSAVRVDVETVNRNIPPRPLLIRPMYIDLTDPRWTLPALRRRPNAPDVAVVDLTERGADAQELETDSLSRDDCQLQTESDKRKTPISHEQELNLHVDSLADSAAALAPQQDCGDPEPNQMRLSSPTQQQNQEYEGQSHQNTTAAMLTQLPFLETHVQEPEQSAIQFSLGLSQQDNSEAPDCCHREGTTAAGHISDMVPLSEAPPDVAESQFEEQAKGEEAACLQEQENELQQLQSPTGPPFSEKGSFVTTSQEHSTQEYEIPDSLELNERDFLAYENHISPNLETQVNPPATSEQDEDKNEWPLETETYRDDMEMDSPVSFLWQEGSDGEDMNEDSCGEATHEDRQYVCPVALRKLMDETSQGLIDEDSANFGTHVVLCHQSLGLVYSTIDENLIEGTLQLLSDLLQPGYCPPKDITSHLVRGILLDRHCPHHFCVQAFNLLMRTQRHHMATRSTVPWDWELLTSVMANQEHRKMHRCEVVRMFLEYVVQTLEDDFWAKHSSSVLHLSVAKAVLSCDQQFPRVREVIKWLFNAIIKSSEHEDSRESSRERGEQIRMVYCFQKMLCLALKVDRSPALSATKLSQELFHMLISNPPLRAYRMLLLELQSKLLKCKLLETLLDHASLKILSAMSLSLLPSLLKNCTLASDPMDGGERWQKWEELVQLLWMLLFSYDKAMKGYLCNSLTEQRDRAGTLVYKKDDMVSKSAVHEATEAFLSRTQADLGQSLPLHVEESLTYLQDHLLDVCQC
ncbi:LOW QUALITY PROTEIN: uncharacterized protein simc1 [Pholidichthys leucotaenia]